MRDRGDAVARHVVRAEALLELAASGYERAQRDRLRYGEQLRAILQRRDARWESVMHHHDREDDPDSLLREIRETGGGPVPLLGRMYANAWDQERHMGAQMQALIARHPAWPWLREVRGIGSVLALLVLVLGLAAATVWFVALPALDRTPVERTCEVVILKSGAPDCVSDVPRASQKAPQKASRAAKR